jgi:hypothetical protein
MEPPTILPIVTGRRLPIRKLLQFKFGKSAAVFPITVQNEFGAPDFMNKPIEIK